MTMLMRAKDIVGMVVVTLGGDDVAEVRDVVYEPTGGEILGFTLNGRGWLAARKAESLAWAPVVAVGPDAVMIRDDSALDAPADAVAALDEPPSERNVLGAVVLTDTGTRLGTVSDLIVAFDTRAEVVGYEIETAGTPESEHGNATRFLPRPQQLAISGDALLVPDEVEQFFRDDLSGFGAAVDDYRALLRDAR